MVVVVKNHVDSLDLGIGLDVGERRHTHVRRSWNISVLLDFGVICNRIGRVFEVLGLVLFNLLCHPDRRFDGPDRVGVDPDLVAVLFGEAFPEEPERFDIHIGMKEPTLDFQGFEPVLIDKLFGLPDEAFGIQRFASGDLALAVFVGELVEEVCRPLDPVSRPAANVVAQRKTGSFRC